MSTPPMFTQTMIPVPPLCIYIQALNSDGLTPLGRAVWKGHLNIVEYLINEGKADINGM